MAKLIYAMPTSLDGYIAEGDYEWSAPTEEELAFMTDALRPVGTYLYGRKMYQTMAVWETPDFIQGQAPAGLDFARMWQAADKIVYSKSLQTVSTAETRLEPEFDPQAVRDLKARLPHDVTVAGPTLAAHAIRAGLVDEFQLFVVPVMIGGGIPILPSNVRVELELLDERRFGNGWVYLRYGTRGYRTGA